MYHIQEDKINDETDDFISSRYVSSSESCYRIFHFAMQKQYPSITRLAVHLENEQLCSFSPDDDIDDVLENSKKTTLTEWFEMNKKYPEARKLKYFNFTDEYVWYVGLNKWLPRKSGKLYTII